LNKYSNNAQRRYTTVPSNLKDNEVFPNFSDIPSILTTIRHPRRRAISIGPQSEADAYETLAYREKRRRESQSGGSRESPADGDNKANGNHVQSRKTSKLDDYEHMMGRGSPQSGTSELDSNIPRSSPLPPPQYETNRATTRADEKEVFSQIKKPRVRYDVEVVTKLVVYAGMYRRSFPTHIHLLRSSRYSMGGHQRGSPCIRIARARSSLLVA
jgi:hypothetical protein